MEVNSNRIFFCYDTMDKEVVAEFYQMLKDEGFNPWMAGVDILVGQNRNRRKRIALKSSKLVVVFFSKNSVSDKGDIQSELKFVFDILKEVSEDETCIIPIRLDECAIPDELQHIEYVDLIDKSGYEKTIKVTQIAQ